MPPRILFPIVLFGLIVGSASAAWTAEPAEPRSRAVPFHSLAADPFAIAEASGPAPVVDDRIVPRPPPETVSPPLLEQEAFEQPAASCHRAHECADETGGCRKTCCEQPTFCDCLLGASRPLKDMPLESICDSDCQEGSTLTVGGALRYRYMDEDNRLRPGGPARSTYDLWRWRNHFDFRHSDVLRVYVEMIDASIFDEELAPLPVDVNRADIVQGYADVKIGERDGKPVVVRVGRQFLSYGAQRLISPLGWSNTFRNFEGIKVFSPGDVWDIDAFTTRPVDGATGNLFHPTSRDHADASRTFSGVYATYHGVENNVVDLYWLWLREQEPVPALMDGSRHTVGARWAGKHPVADCCGEPQQIWTWDIEGAFQFGHDNDLLGVEQNVVAGFLTAVAGHTWSGVPWSPKLEGLFHWGSGDDDPADGDVHTVSTLFPLGHAYWGLIDNLSGQNLIDYSVQGSVKPAERLTLAAAVHWFNLDEGADRVYNVAGVALGPGDTGSNLGQELDLVATYEVHENLSVQIGYFWFWYGQTINNGPLARDDASQLYVMTTLGY